MSGRSKSESGASADRLPSSTHGYEYALLLDVMEAGVLCSVPALWNMTQDQLGLGVSGRVKSKE